MKSATWGFVLGSTSRSIRLVESNRTAKVRRWFVSGFCKFNFKASRCIQLGGFMLLWFYELFPFHTWPISRELYVNTISYGNNLITSNPNARFEFVTNNLNVSWGKSWENQLIAAFNEGKNYNKGPIRKSLYIAYWDLESTFSRVSLCLNKSHETSYATTVKWWIKEERL